jgi:hypothetical protein
VSECGFQFSTFFLVRCSLWATKLQFVSFMKLVFFPDGKLIFISNGVPLMLLDFRKSAICYGVVRKLGRYPAPNKTWGLMTRGMATERQLLEAAACYSTRTTKQRSSCTTGNRFSLCGLGGQGSS